MGATSFTRCAAVWRRAWRTWASWPAAGAVTASSRELRGDGVSEELLERIDVPAGIDIGARTPAEVAVSILAKLIAVRRGTDSRARHAPRCGELDVHGDR